MNMLKGLMVVVAVSTTAVLSGCNSLANLQASCDTVKNPELFTDGAGWDHRGPGEFTCKHGLLESVKIAMSEPATKKI